MKFKIFLYIGIALIVQPYGYASVKSEVKKGNLLYNRDEFDEAIKHYDKALDKDSESDIINYNLGDAFYKKEDYREAINYFQKSLLSDDEELEHKSNYNIGNAKYKYALLKEKNELQLAVNLMQEGIHHYNNALKIEANDEDAKYNQRQAKKELKRLKDLLKKQEKQKDKEKDKGKDKASEPKEEDGSETTKDDQESENSKDEQKDSKEKESEQAAQPKSESEEEARRKKSDQANQEQMTEEEAEKILKIYSQQEEPKGLYKGKKSMRSLRGILKDW